MQSLLETVQKQRGEQRRNAVEQLGIFELRGLAREMGIHSPTTRKREELIRLIMETFANGIPTNQEKVRKGRPVKTLQNMDEIMNRMTGEDKSSFASASSRLKTYEQVATFNQEIPVFSLLSEEIVGVFSGVLRKKSNIAYFVDVATTNKVFVSQDFVSEYNLAQGDFIEGVGQKINMANQFAITKLNRINFVDYEKYHAHAAEITPKKAVISSETLKFGNANLYRGRRNIIRYQKNLFEDERYSTFVNNLIKDGFKVVTVSLNTICEDEIIFEQEEKVIKMNTSYGMNSQLAIDRVVDAIALVERLTQIGQKVVLFINDIIETLNALEICFERKEVVMGHSAEAIVIVQKLISLARAYSDGSETTVVMTYRDLNFNDEFLVNQVFKISTKFE